MSLNISSPGPLSSSNVDDQGESPPFNNNNNKVLPLPYEFMVVSNQSLVIIVVAISIFVFASVGNIYVVWSLRKRLARRYLSIHKLILHMVYAELLVIFFTIPLEIAWRFSIGWYAGSSACKIANFVRCFIYFLSSLILICLSLDCFCNVFFTYRQSAKFNNGAKRVRIMIILSWMVAGFSAIPKYYLSFVRTDPFYTSFQQCLLETAPIFFSVYPLVESYFAPFIVIVLTFVPIFFRLSQRFERVLSDKEEQPTSPGTRLSTSFELQQVQGVKLSFAFALVSIICYTPQIGIILWHYFCPTFQPNSNHELFVYFLETSKSVALPVVYRIFR